MRIEVTQEHIDADNASTNTLDAVSMAIEEATGLRAYVVYQKFNSTISVGRKQFNMPCDVRQFFFARALGGGKPFTFYLPIEAAE